MARGTFFFVVRLFMFLVAVGLVLLSFWIISIVHNEGYTTSVNEHQAITPTVIPKIQQQRKIKVRRKAFYPTSLSELQGHLPTWVYEYIQWHNQQRQLFPDEQLLTHPDSPKLLIKYCPKLCGGLHDRLSSLHDLLWVAYQTKRVLLIRWFTPKPLELFLAPNLLNWTVPIITERSNSSFTKLNKRSGLAEVTTDFLHGWTKQQEQNYLNPLEHARDALAHVPVLSLFYSKSSSMNLTYEMELQGIVNVFDSADPTTTQTGVTASPFGHLWHALFRPSAEVEAMLVETQQYLGLLDDNNAYIATHCRVRHPGRYQQQQNPQGKIPGTSADVSGLPFEREYRDIAVRTALHAMECTQWAERQWSERKPRQENTIYLLSDSEDLVAYLADEIVGDRKSPWWEVYNNTTNLTALEKETLAWKQAHPTARIVSRDVINIPATHLDRQKRVPKRTYMATFVDLYLSIGAKCVGFGIGNFAYLAIKISGTPCTVRHEDFVFTGNNDSNKNWFNQRTGGAPVCPIPMMT